MNILFGVIIILGVVIFAVVSTYANAHKDKLWYTDDEK